MQLHDASLHNSWSIAHILRSVQWAVIPFELNPIYFFIFQHLQVTESHNDSTTTCSLRSYSRLNDVHNKQPGNKMEESFMERSSASKIQRESTSVTSFWNLKRRSSSPVGPCSCSLHVMGLTLHWPEGALTFVKQIYIKSPIIVLE